MKLKRKCAIAMLIAVEALTLSNAAINAVMVVPMLAPKIKGAAFRSDTIFCATIGTTTEMVIVLERMAAVVTMPQKKDFHAFLKKNRLKRSGDVASKRPEINFRNNKMDVKSNMNANKARRNPFGIIVNRKSTAQPKSVHRPVNELSTGTAEG